MSDTPTPLSQRPQPAQPTEANSEQIEFWNVAAGDRWVAYQQELDFQLAPFGDVAMRALIPRPGERLLDVGCGCGTTSIELAKHVGSGGTVIGVDISSPMLEIARRRAQTAAIGNAEFLHADAQSYVFEESSFDGVFSRFGVMFFSDPVAAFSNLAAALRPGGRVSFICWRELMRNPWMLVPVAAAAQHVSMQAPPDPEAPGPFAFADNERVAGILEQSGFKNMALTSFDQVMTLGDGGDAERTAEFMLQLGPVARVLPDVDDATRDKVRTAVREALEPFATPQGVLMDSSCWLVTAERP